MLEFLLKIPTGFWTAVLTLVATFLGVYITNRANDRRTDKQHQHDLLVKNSEILRVKGEEFTVAVLKYCRSMTLDHIPYIAVMQGKLEYNDALDMSIERGERRDYDIDQLRMMCALYFPGVKTDLAELLVTNQSTLDLRERFKLGYELKPVDLDAAEEYRSSCLELDRQASVFQEKLDSIVRSKINVGENSTA